MDLSNFDTSKTEKGVELTIVSPVDGKDTDIKITLVGSDSSQYRNSIKRRAETKINSAKKKQAVDLDEIEETSIELLADCTLGWSGIEENGKPVEYSRANVIAIYSKYRWLREQVDAFIGDRTNFFPKPSKN